MQKSILQIVTAVATAASLISASPPALPHQDTGHTEAFASRTYFYAGGQYDNFTQAGSNEPGVYMVGQAYVEKLVPHEVKHAIPLVFISGNAQTGTNWLNTPDNREGWASFFLRRGYVVYLTDQTMRGRSAWLPGQGNVSLLPVSFFEKRFTAPQDFPSYPQAKTHTQWPGSGRRGDPIFDAFTKSQVQLQTNITLLASYNNASYAALLDDIGPAIVITHSQSGQFGWQLGDARPDLVKAIVALEPEGPPFHDYSGPPFVPGYTTSKAERPFGLTVLPIAYDPPIGTSSSMLARKNVTAPSPDLAPCTLQKEPARKLANLSKIPVLILTSESSYHAVYDYCTVAFLKQAGVKVDYFDLPKEGIHGNGHFIFMEKNNLKVAQRIAPWIDAHGGRRT